MQDPIHSPYFDGSPYSQSGNGVWAPHNCTRPNPRGPYCTPVIEGEGGGCIDTGPYVGIMTNISATQPGLNASDAPIPGALLSYQPRCIRRDLSMDLSSRFLSDDHLYHILTYPVFQNSSIGPFQDYFEGGSGYFPSGKIPTQDIDLGLHGSAHYSIGGDPGGDVRTPVTPLFLIVSL